MFRICQLRHHAFIARCACIAFVVLPMACHAPRYTAQTFPAEQLMFGNGGGFSGEETTYTLLPNGQLFQSSGFTEAQEELEPVPKKEATRCFEQAHAVAHTPFNHPGNRYHFITYKTSSQENRIVWGGTEAPPAQVTALYNALTKLIPHQ